MQAVLLVETGLANPRVCKLTQTMAVRLGRYRTNTIVLNDPHVSRFHAEIYTENGSWFIRNCSETNGTRINGEPIQAPTPLCDDQEIHIGDCRLRFRIEAAGDLDTDELPGRPAAPASHTVAESSADSSTHLQPDELSALNQFLTEALLENSVRGVVGKALAILHNATRADLAGFLSLDPDDPLPRLVWPAQRAVDPQLSRRLTQQALATKQLVWLAAAQGATPSADFEGHSLAGYRDAVCVPLRATATPQAAEDMTLGALHLYRAQRPFSQRQVYFCQALASCLANHLTVLRTRRVLEAENARLRISGARANNLLIGDSPVLQQLREQIAKVADHPCSVLIVGESGVGKELVALALHQQSRRHENPLVAVNCAAITASMPEAELFGHEAGAFTGATRERQGYFQQADEGTLFLDEIGELSLDCQAKLLRVLETKSFRPLGLDRGEVCVNVRVIAASNRDLRQEVDKGKFRTDLFFRLGVVIRVPPLRDHVEDIPGLVDYFLTGLNAEYRRDTKLAPAALKCLQAHPWPGNVRQLRSVLESAVAMSDRDVLEPRDFHLTAEAHTIGDLPDTLDLEQLEAWAIRQALRKVNGVQIRAAQELGINRDTLLNKIKKYHIDRNG